MTLFYLAVIAFAIGYIALVAMKYNERVNTLKPYIAETTESNEALKGTIRDVKEEIHAIVGEIKEEEIVVKDVKVGITDVEKEIAEEKALHEKLELASQVKQFNKGKS